MITQPIANPVTGASAPAAPAPPPMAKEPEISEPYIRTIEPKVEEAAPVANTPAANTPPAATPPTSAPLPQHTFEFSEDALAPRVKPVEKTPEPAPETVKHGLYDEVENTTGTADASEQRSEVREARLTPNEHQMRVEERQARMREMNMRMKSPAAVAEYEREPAYVRKKVQLNDAPQSTDSNISRYSLSEGTDENGERRVELKRNNPYLHDKVD